MWMGHAPAESLFQSLSEDEARNVSHCFCWVSQETAPGCWKPQDLEEAKKKKKIEAGKIKTTFFYLLEELP